MLLPQTWRVGLMSLGIGLNAFTIVVHTAYGFNPILPKLASHKNTLYDVVGVCFIHLMVLPAISIILQLKWLQFGLNTPYDEALLGSYVLGNLGFGAWYYALGARAPLLSTVASPIVTLLSAL
ncbi:hypothetical protein BDW59DRAFT_161726 [Aspergillus cavernicola]|uniref:EamA domain-containing protein n=1 Tax=Aspergillus cavernicola TaxID=176166 RepID=A0ABR4ICP6_9EURO